MKTLLILCAFCASVVTGFAQRGPAWLVATHPSASAPAACGTLVYSNSASYSTYWPGTEYCGQYFDPQDVTGATIPLCRYVVDMSANVGAEVQASVWTVGGSGQLVDQIGSFSSNTHTGDAARHVVAFDFPATIYLTNGITYATVISRKTGTANIYVFVSSAGGFAGITGDWGADKARVSFTSEDTMQSLFR
jgi:hypothetical protein